MTPIIIDITTNYEYCCSVNIETVRTVKKSLSVHLIKTDWKITNVLATGGKFVIAERCTHRGNSVANNVGKTPLTYNKNITFFWLRNRYVATLQMFWKMEWCIPWLIRSMFLVFLTSVNNLCSINTTVYSIFRFFHFYLNVQTRAFVISPFQFNPSSST